jgi:hypothetical protein
MAFLPGVVGDDASLKEFAQFQLRHTVYLFVTNESILELDINPLRVFNK